MRRRTLLPLFILTALLTVYLTGFPSAAEPQGEIIEKEEPEEEVFTEELPVFDPDATYVGGQAFTESDEGFSYVESDVADGWRITGYKLEGKNLTVPEIIAGAPVVEIGDTAFYGMSDIRSVVLPDTVVRIGKDAFGGCSALEKVVLSASLTEIGDGAFAGDVSLLNAALPDSLRIIGDSAFSGCRLLTALTLPASLTYIGEDAFSGCVNLMLNAENSPVGQVYVQEHHLSGSVFDSDWFQFVVCAAVAAVILAVAAVVKKRVRSSRPAKRTGCS